MPEGAGPPERPSVVLDGRFIDDHFPGVGRYTYSLAKGLGRLAEVEVFLLYRSGPGNQRYELEPLLSLPGIRPVKTTVRRSLLDEQLRLPFLLRGLEADLLHSPFYLTPHLTSMPRVVTVFDLIPLRYPSGRRFLVKRLLFEIAVRAAVRRSRLVITPSRHVSRELSARFGLSPERTRVVPLAAAEHLRPAERAEVERTRRRLGLPERYVLTLSSGKPHKNLPGLLAAAQILAQEGLLGEATGLVVAGVEEEDVPVAATKLPGRALRWLGKVPESDLAALYSGAELFVFPSLDEGFGLPVVEAMACGTAVLASSAGSLAEVVGEGGVLVPVDQPELLAAAMRSILSEPEKGREWAERALRRSVDFSWKRTAELTLEVYREALEERRSRPRAAAGRRALRRSVGGGEGDRPLLRPPGDLE